LGAKLSGGGCGGNMIALAQSDAAGQVVEALLRAGAVRSFPTLIGL
jgi:mevalonate kinase